MTDILELSKFNHIKYLDEPHLYFINETQQTSATTFIGQFKPKFKTQEIAEKYAKKHGKTVREVLDDWDFKREFSTFKGSLFHDYVENYLANKIYPYDPKNAVKEFGVDVITEPFEKLKEMFWKFYAHSKENLIPIKSEWVIGDEELGLCGMIDQFYYNKKAGEYQIWDWKTNKAINDKNDYGEKFKHPIEHLDVCELNTYSLQLSLYKYIIHKNTNLKVGDCYIAWFHEKNDTYKIIKVKDLTDEIISMIKYKND